MNTPLVSCLMVTKNRVKLARRAVECFARQTWPNKELVIIDDGEEDYGPLVEEYRGRCTIHYHKYVNDTGMRVGGLRNVSLERANGEYCIQWDDDEWYDAKRIEVQMESLLRQGLDVITLFSTIMHLDTPEYLEHPYRSNLRRGIPGTILHRKTPVRYPDGCLGEDSIYLDDLRKAYKVGLVDVPHSHLFFRCFHGKNSWDYNHFFKKLKYTFRDKLSWFAAKYLRRNLLTHPRFRLNETEKKAFAEYMEFSRSHGLFKS